MANTFLCSDLHLGHRNSLTFFRTDGITKLRPFETVEQMNDTIIANINSVVSNNDRLYILGDATMPQSAIPLLRGINGIKTLIMGNHDHQPHKYSDIFKKIVAYHEFDGCAFSHIPLHTSQMNRYKRNVHGHTHDVHLMKNENERDGLYYNVSIDAYATTDGTHSGMNFFPKSWDDIKKEMFVL